jgi:aromatic ring hydroxylase
MRFIPIEDVAMARKIKFAATHFSIAFSMSYAANQNVAISALIGVAEPLAFVFGRSVLGETRTGLALAPAA